MHAWRPTHALACRPCTSSRPTAGLTDRLGGEQENGLSEVFTGGISSYSLTWTAMAHLMQEGFHLVDPSRKAGQLPGSLHLLLPYHLLPWTWAHCRVATFADSAPPAWTPAMKQSVSCSCCPLGAYAPSKTPPAAAGASMSSALGKAECIVPRSLLHSHHVYCSACA